MKNRIIITASVFGALAVALGAFGAHGLKDAVDTYSLGILEKGVQYQFYHTFALLFLSLNANETGKTIKYAYWFFVAGVVLFSGSLYLLALRQVFDLGIAHIVGPVTPIGGLSFILGWILLLTSALKRK